MIHVITHDLEVTVRVHDELSMDNLEPLEGAFDTAKTLDVKKFVVDLTECTYIDSTAISLFVRLWKRYADRFEVRVRPTGLPYTVLEVCGFLAVDMFVRVVAADAELENG